MCNRYQSPTQAAIDRVWRVGRQSPSRWWANDIFPRAQGPFIRAAGGERELVVGQWGLVPHFAKTAKLAYQTNNARSEELSQKASYKQPWVQGQRCIIPAVSFDEPCWETGRNVWWTLRRADGNPWGLAGLWNTWIDKDSGEVVESYTMLTINADAHPLMRRMHKPDPTLGPDEQDKRSVIAIELDDVDAWLHGSVAQATVLLKLPTMESFDASSGPERPGPGSQPSLL